jgi:hypothetical protein
MKTKPTGSPLLPPPAAQAAHSSAHSPAPLAAHSQQQLQRKAVRSAAYPPAAIVFTRLGAFMQHLADLVSRGYIYFDVHRIDIGRAEMLRQKFAELYCCDADAARRYKRKKLGLANAQLVMLHASLTDDHFTFVLVATAGNGEIRSNRGLRDARDHRLIIDGYELVRRQRPDADATPRANAGAPSWTWQLTKKRTEELRAAVLGYARGGHAQQMRELYRGLHQQPGFAGVRIGAKKLVLLARREWKARHRASRPFPCEAMAMPWLRRVAHERITPAAAQRRHDAHAKATRREQFMQLREGTG